VTAGAGGRVCLLYVDGCPNLDAIDERLRRALTLVGRADETIEYGTVSTPEQAEEMLFRGSPTVLIDGRDPFLDSAAPVALSCRLYPADDGVAGFPTVEQLVAVLHPVSG